MKPDKELEKEMKLSVFTNNKKGREKRDLIKAQLLGRKEGREQSEDNSQQKVNPICTADTNNDGCGDDYYDEDLQQDYSCGDDFEFEGRIIFCLCPKCKVKMLEQQLAEKDKNFKIKEMEILDEGVEIGKEKATSDILKKIEGLDDMFLSKATMNYSERGDTWTILKQDWNKIVEKIKGVGKC